MRIVALDVSLNSTGYAHQNGVGVIVPPRGKDRGMARIHYVRSRILDLVIPDVAADLVVIEGYAFGAQGQGIYDRAELGGVIRYALWDMNIPYVEISPASLKQYATGKGNAKKEVVLAEAIRRLDYKGTSNDEADALWLYSMAYDHYHLSDCGAIMAVPQSHRAALAKVQWPKMEALV
jgi:Holliday junction resolvasome RuvABC endonuclease subunit